VFRISGGDDWAADAAAALRQVPRSFIVEIFAGDEHPPATRTPSLPFPLFGTEHPNPSYFYSDLI
jgi:hypothetical protein